jgi:hypothetical protein
VEEAPCNPTTWTKAKAGGIVTYVIAESSKKYSLESKGMFCEKTSSSCIKCSQFSAEEDEAPPCNPATWTKAQAGGVVTYKISAASNKFSLESKGMFCEEMDGIDNCIKCSQFSSGD